MSSCIILALISAGLLGADIEENGMKNETETKSEQAIPEARTEARLDTALSSDAHIRIIATLVFILFLSRHDSMLVLVFFPLVFAVVRLLATSLNLKESLQSLFYSGSNNVGTMCNKLVNIVVPGSLRKFIVLLFTSDRMVFHLVLEFFSFLLI